MSDSPKSSEPIRLALDLIHAALAPLSKEQRVEVLGRLDLACAKMVTEANAEVDKLRNQVRELAAFNEQRHAEVWNLRELISARPDETLAKACLRWGAAGALMPTGKGD
jgi:hypothetical protein